MAETAVTNGAVAHWLAGLERSSNVGETFVFRGRWRRDGHRGGANQRNGSKVLLVSKGRLRDQRRIDGM